MGSLRRDSNGNLLRTSDGGLMQNCCCGVCASCDEIGGPPSRLTFTNFKLTTAYEIAQAHPEWYDEGLPECDSGIQFCCDSVEKYLCGLCPFFNGEWVCWQRWGVPGGCSQCSELSEAEITLEQKPSFGFPVCCDTPDCNVLSGTFESCADPGTGNPWGCASQAKLDCNYQATRFVCTEEPSAGGMGFSGDVAAQCCSTDFQTTPGNSINPWSLPQVHPCSGYQPMNICAYGGGSDPGFDPNTYFRYCDCDEGCNFGPLSPFGDISSCEGVRICAGGCCFFQHYWTAQISGPSGGFYTVSFTYAQRGVWEVNATPGFTFRQMADSYSGTKSIPEEEWDCLETEVEFFCEDITFNSSIATNWSNVGGTSFFCPLYHYFHPGGCMDDCGEFDTPCVDCCVGIPFCKIRRG